VKEKEILKCSTQFMKYGISQKSYVGHIFLFFALIVCYLFLISIIFCLSCKHLRHVICIDQ